MSIMIRLKRIGTHKRPFYTIVAVDSRKRRDGRVLEILGHYNPCGGGREKVTFLQEKIRAWIEKGALLSPTVKSLLKIRREKE
ncbi:MAG: 30S ribosomal protein S16 [bacterium]